MRLTRQLALALGVAACLVASATAQDLVPSGPAVENAILITYDPADGNLSVDGTGVSMTTIELKSAGELFIPANATGGIFNPPFDVNTPSKLFTLKTEGFGSLDFGPVLSSRFDASDGNGLISPSTARFCLRADWSMHPAVVPTSSFPEPASMGLMLLGTLGLLSVRRK